MAVYKVFLFNTRKFSPIAIQSFNCILRNTTVHEIVFNSLNSCIADDLVVKICMFMLLIGTYEQAKIAQILIDRISSSTQSRDMMAICIKILHEFGMKAGLGKKLNLDYIHEKIGCSVNHYRQPSERFTYLWPKYHERLNSFNLLSRVGYAFYSWNVFRMDDFHFTMKEYSISPKLKVNWIDEKSPPMMALNCQEIPIDEEDEDNEIEVNDESDVKINDLIWIRPKNKAKSSRFGSQRQLRSSLDGTNSFYTRSRTSIRNEKETDFKEIDIESMDAIFDSQNQIEDENIFDASTYESLIDNDIMNCNIDKLEITGNSYDDSHLLFHGLSRDNHYTTADSECSMTDFFRNSRVVILMKCYVSNYDEDQELKNLVNSLGTKFQCLPDIVLPYSVPRVSRSKRSLIDTDLSPTEVIVVQGFGAVTYIIVDNDQETLEEIIGNPTQNMNSPRAFKSPYYFSDKSRLPFLILYGFENEIENYQYSQEPTVRKFNRIISLSKSFDVDVLQVKVTQVV